MLTRPHKRFLKNTFPAHALLLDPEPRAAHGTDNSRILAMPWAVVRPETEQEIETPAGLGAPGKNPDLPPRAGHGSGRRRGSGKKAASSFPPCA